VSGPVSTVDAPPVAVEEAAAASCIEVTPSRQATVGDLQVRRALPRRGRRTVGAWCFADHLGPASVSEEKGVDIGPHPHTGLHTVTWLVAGEMLHRDSLGSSR
jgi:redox-sensitive bicupin YhaK (pirin superfamily)